MIACAGGKNRHNRSIFRASCILLPSIYDGNMDSSLTDCIKHRDILFADLHDRNDSPAHLATLLLADAPGIIRLYPHSETRLQLSYDLRHVSLKIIETGLAEVGFHLENSIMCKLRRALYHYTEETQCMNMGCHPDSKMTRDIYIHRYQRLPHGCRDERPTHWRKYL